MTRLLAFVGFLAAAAPAFSQTTCRQALALGLDVSGSVDSLEYRLQLDGLALALGDPEVVDALLAQPSMPVQIAVYEWSDPGDERLILDWRPVNNLFDINEIQAVLHTTLRGNMGPSTGLGSALEKGFALLNQQPDCWTRTLDISGDGKGNTGRRPQDVANTPNGVTVNGLVIGIDDHGSGSNRNLQIGGLASYYTAYVIRGPNAFVETALGFDAYQDAMIRKLLRELQTVAIGQLRPSH